MQISISNYWLQVLISDCVQRQELEVLYCGGLFVVIAAVCQVLKQEPQRLKGTISMPDLDKTAITAKCCLNSVYKNRLQENATKRIDATGWHCSPGILGRFLCSQTFKEARAEIDRCEQCNSRGNARSFRIIQNSLMLAAGITNAHRTGDRRPVQYDIGTVSERRTSRAYANDHIVHVLRHKTFSTKLCKVNFYNRLFSLTQRYVDYFAQCFWSLLPLMIVSFHL